MLNLSDYNVKLKYFNPLNFVSSFINLVHKGLLFVNQKMLLKGATLNLITSMGYPVSFQE